jgi:hypothetical protein
MFRTRMVLSEQLTTDHTLSVNEMSTPYQSVCGIRLGHESTELEFLICRQPASSPVRHLSEMASEKYTTKRRVS